MCNVFHMAGMQTVCHLKVQVAAKVSQAELVCILFQVIYFM